MRCTKHCTYNATYSDTLFPEKNIVVALLGHCSEVPYEQRPTNSANEEHASFSQVGAVQVARRTTTRTAPKAKLVPIFKTMSLHFGTLYIYIYIHVSLPLG